MKGGGGESVKTLRESNHSTSGNHGTSGNHDTSGNHSTSADVEDRKDALRKALSWRGNMVQVRE